ncbi:MAG TPA: hypothetical protein EYH14_01555 [Euryarchaeota archaeon]|nr:hypothetical protein [Euryarchaeota archaeon]
MKDELKQKIKAALGKGVVQYVPPKEVLESIIEQLIAEGKIPPREKWGEIKRREAPPEGSE